MLVLDNSLLSDYLNGAPEARAFLEQRESEEWAVSSIVLYEALMGAVYGHIAASPEAIRAGVSASMGVLATTEQTAVEGRTLQEELLERGAPVAQLDALIAASAREHGGTFATAEKRFWVDEVRSVLDVEPYDPH